ncbi:MAG: hypothetical protein NTX03_08140, partial [Bacteroidetes bacterium]|nr:hypothetical protein [Bacteroidota bacterium]
KFDKKDEFTGVQTTYTNEVIVIHESAFKLFEDADECTIKMGLCCQNNKYFLELYTKTTGSIKEIEYLTVKFTNGVINKLRRFSSSKEATKSFKSGNSVSEQVFYFSLKGNDLFYLKENLIDKVRIEFSYSPAKDSKLSSSDGEKLKNYAGCLINKMELKKKDNIAAKVNKLDSLNTNKSIGTISPKSEKLSQGSILKNSNGDYILKLDSSNIHVKIMKIEKTTLTYKDWDNIDGPDYILELKEIVKVTFSNGSIKYFKKE